VLTVETNLPDETALMLGFSDEAWLKCDPEQPCLTGKTYEDEVAVNRGRARSAFGPENGLYAGKWEASALVPYPSVQPDAVRAVIGQTGEKLKGPLVKRKAGSEPLVEATVTFTVH